MTLSLFQPKVTAADILTALRTRHPAKEWIYVEEVRAGTGHEYAQWDNEARKYIGGRGDKAIAQRLDAWALQMWSPGAIVAYEVKVTRADFLREIKDPTKRAFALLVSSEFYFVTPVKLIGLDELPEECGLIEVYEDGRIRTKRKAPSRPAIAPPTWNFVGSLMRRQRREMYVTGPGHPGQCPGFGRYVKDETEWSGERWTLFSNTDEMWCSHEAGHPNQCRVRTAA